MGDYTYFRVTSLLANSGRILDKIRYAVLHDLYISVNFMQISLFSFNESRAFYLKKIYLREEIYNSSSRGSQNLWITLFMSCG